MNRKKGSITVFFSISLVAVVTAVFLSINAGKYYTERKQTDNAAEAIALSLATWEARYMNCAALLNKGTVECIWFIRMLLIRGAAAVGQAVGGHLSPIIIFSRVAPKAIRSLWSYARKYSDLNKKIKKLYFPTLLECEREMAKYYGVNGISYPLLPGDKGNSRRRLSLPLRESDALMIFGSIKEAIARARSHKPKNPFKRKLFKIAFGMFERTVRHLFRLKGNVHLQVPLDKAPVMGKIHYLAYTDETSPFLNNLFEKRYRTWNVAAATIKAGGVYSWTWKSRLIPSDSNVFQKLMKNLKRRAR